MSTLLAPPFPPLPSSPPPSLVMQLTKILYEYYNIILLIVIFTSVSSISTSNLKKIFFAVGFCVGVILGPVIFISIITWVPRLFSFFIILAVLVSLLSSILIPRHHQASQESQPYDIEAGPPEPAVLVAIQDPQPAAVDPAYETLSYKMDEESEHCSGDVCVVCLEAFEEQDECGRLIKCRHVYHRKCIDLWLAIPQHKLCPICCHNVYN